MSIRSTLRAAAIVAAVTLAGCQGKDLVKAPDGGAKDPLPAAAYPEIVFVNDVGTRIVRGLPPFKGGTSYASEPTFEEPMKVRVPVRSVVDRDTRIEFRVLYFAPDGEQLNTAPVWRERAVQPRVEVVLEDGSVTNKASKFRMEIREAR
jgi:hypothetical protein